MTSPSSAPDWPAAEALADRLGNHSRSLVAARAQHAVHEWAIIQARENTAGPRADAYRELAALTGFDTERLVDEFSDAAA